MIVIPVRKSPKYRKIISTHVEIIGADFKVDTIVSFKERTVEEYKYVECCLCSVSTTDIPVRKASYKYEPAVQYAFRTPVCLSGEEYKNNRHNINEYVCNKAKESSKYKQSLQECLSKVFNDREYDVETFLLNDPECNVIHTMKTEYEEYIPF